MQPSLQDTQQPYAIVIGLDCITGLQTARILTGRRIPVIGIASNPQHFCCRTKVCERILFTDTAGYDLIRTLETLGPTLQHKAVLFPCTDMSVLQLSRARQRLQAWYRLVLPEPNVVEMLMDKIGFYTYAQNKGLPIPGTRFLHTRADAQRAVEELSFPCILKPPMKTPTWQQNARVKVYKASSAAEFLALYDRCSDWADVLMAQEWIEGTDADLYSCNCYFTAASEPIVTFIARKLRQWPPETGTSSLGEECRNDVVLQESIRLFRSVGYYGLGYVEMKRDARTGKYYIIEPNIGRPTGRSAIAEAGGVDLLYTMYCDAIGWALPLNREQKYKGVKWVYLRHDLQSALYYWRRGDLTLIEWWRSWRGPKAYAVFSWTDPAPFWGDLFKAVGLLRSKRKTREPAHQVEQPVNPVL